MDHIERGLALTCQRLFDEASRLLSIGRFRLLRSLGRGGNGCVYEALDLRHQRRVALKVLHERRPDALVQLEREFHALAGLRHPNLVALHELHVERTLAYYTMDLVEGEDFLGHATYCQPESLIHSLLQLSRGVQALHAANKLHRDLKPDNVLATRLGGVVLIDLDLVTPIGQRETSVGGTHAYMAPEQRAGHACQGSDWYSVGVMLLGALRARREVGQPYPSQLDRLATQLTSARPCLRPTYRQFVAALASARLAKGEPS